MVLNLKSLSVEQLENLLTAIDIAINYAETEIEDNLYYRLLYKQDIVEEEIYKRMIAGEK